MGYNDNFKERIVTAAYYLVEINYRNPYKENDTWQGSL
jgi:hypothetical protein